MIKISLPRIKKLLNKAIRLLISEDLANKKSISKLLSLRRSSLELSVIFVNDRTMRALNFKYRGKNKITDVLSFPQVSEFKHIGTSFHKIPFFLGDIVINIHQAKRQSIYNNLLLYDEILRLIIHGLLHLVGYDHEKNAYQAKRMNAVETKLFEKLKKS